MGLHIKMHYYLVQLHNGFMHKDRAVLLDSFCEFATHNKAMVAKTMANVSPDASEVYWNFLEAVFDHAADWRDLICAEFSRLLARAQAMPDPTPVINSLEAFHILKDSADESLLKSLKQVITEYLDTSNFYLKRFLVWFFTNCLRGLEKSDIDLVKNLRFDEDVIVRYYAFIFYNTYKGYPPDKGLSAIDKLVIDISDIYVCEAAF